MERRYRLGEGESQLWTRQAARAPRRKIEALLEKADAGDVIIVDAAGVEVFDFSFAAELFGPLLRLLPGQYPGRFLVVENLNEVTRENLGIALLSNGLAITERVGNRPSLIGKVAEVDRQTFDSLLRAGGAASAPELATTLGIALTATNERLAKLVRLGIARRTDADPVSRAFRYSVLT